jgi:hypothetical protein
METGRRAFLETLGLGAAGVAALAGAAATGAAAQSQVAGQWDLSWTRRLTGRYRALFDVLAIEDGFGVWRAAIWRRQYATLFGVAERSLATVVNIRHDAIALAMNNEFWRRYRVGRKWGVRDPATRAPTERNPVIERSGAHALPGEYAGFTLEKLLEGGTVVLGCALALRDCARLVADADRVDMAEAERQVRGMLVPGVILQPSGVFSAVLAQDHGARYVRAS